LILIFIFIQGFIVLNIGKKMKLLENILKRCNSEQVSSYPTLIDSNMKYKETKAAESKPIIQIEKKIEPPVIAQSNERKFQGINNSKPAISLPIFTAKSKKNKSKIEKNNSTSICSIQSDNSIKIANFPIEEKLEDSEVIYIERIRNFIQKKSFKKSSDFNNILIPMIDAEILTYLLDTIRIFENNSSDSSFSVDDLYEFIEYYFPSLTNNLTVMKEFIILLKNIGIEKNELENRIKNYKNEFSKNEINNEILNEEIKTNVQIVVKEELSERDVLDNEEINSLHSMMPNLELDLVRHVYINIGNRSSVEAGQILADCFDEKVIKKLQESKISFDDKQIEIAKQNDLDTKQIQSTIWNKFGDREIIPKYNKNGICV
jgi:hypothetical protein